MTQVNEENSNSAANDFKAQEASGEKGRRSCNFKEADLNNDSNYLYYKEYCKLYYANIILTGRVRISAHLLKAVKHSQRERRAQTEDAEDRGKFVLPYSCQANKKKHEESLGMTFDINDEKRKVSPVSVIL